MAERLGGKVSERVWTPDLVAALKRRKGWGETHAEIARVLGFSVEAVKSKARELRTKRVNICGQRDWSAEEDEILKRLHGEGKSFAEIAKAMGNRTRCACLGRANRLGLRHSPVAKAASQPRQTRPKAPPRPPKPKPVPVVRSTLPAPTEPLVGSLASLEHHHCRWPFGDGPHAFCGHARREGGPYCAEHMAVAYIPPKYVGNAFARGLRGYA